jgi:UDPglucose--hexose-1-phosphate uridylyltransferase
VAELRRHPLSGDWVVICPEKNGAASAENGKDCVFCPGREGETGKEIYRLRGNGDHGDSAWAMRVVAGSPPIFHVEGDFGKQGVGMCDRMEAVGAHEILVESPSHDAEMDSLDESQILAVLDTLRLRAVDLANDIRLKHFLAFKVRAFNHGAGALHPRWDIVAAPFVPSVIKHELNAARKYYAFKERCVFCDYVLQERRARSRVIYEDARVIALSPYAARIPYEVWVLPLRHSPDFATATYDELQSLAGLLRRLTGGIRNIAGAQGYVLTIHTAPFRRPKGDAWKTIDQDYHWHIEIEPSVTIRDNVAESGGFHLNPVSPEEAAGVLANRG